MSNASACSTQSENSSFLQANKFLNFWKDNIEAVIKEVQVSLDGKNKYIHTDFFKELN